MTFIDDDDDGDYTHFRGSASERHLIEGKHCCDLCGTSKIHFTELCQTLKRTDESGEVQDFVNKNENQTKKLIYKMPMKYSENNNELMCNCVTE